MYLDFPLEVKQLTDDGTFTGYASVFNIVDLHKDIIAPGAFRRTLSEHRRRKSMPKMLWQHDSREVVGVWESIEEDEKGLPVQGRLVLGVQRGREAYELLKAGAVSGLSIGFVTRKSKFDEETRVRTITDVDLWEVSLVTFPALPQAQVNAVKAAEIKTIREFEDHLRSIGYSARVAKAIAARGFRGAIDREDPYSADDDRDDHEVAAAIRRLTELYRGGKNG